MTHYQRKTLPSTNIGSPSALPAAISGLSDASLADLSAALGPAAAELGFAGQGYFPVADPPAAPAIPQEVSRMQGLEALRMAGKLDPASAAVASATPAVQLWWANTPVFRRTNPMILAVAAGLGWTDADLDALFTAAAQIVI